MSFWGIEVTPERPVTIYGNSTNGRLRITQATLGSGDGSDRVLVQCKRGRISNHHLLCVLLPNQMETCSLELEFEEVLDVTFFVTGSRNVHLSGYYKNHRDPLFHKFQNENDTDSDGIDIGNTDDFSSDHLSEDSSKYGGSFIDDDDDTGALPASHATTSTPSSNQEKSKRKSKKKKSKKLEKEKQMTGCSGGSDEDDDNEGYMLKIFGGKD